MKTFKGITAAIMAIALIAAIACSGTTPVTELPVEERATAIADLDADWSERNAKFEERIKEASAKKDSRKFCKLKRDQNLKYAEHRVLTGDVVDDYVYEDIARRFRRCNQLESWNSW